KQPGPGSIHAVRTISWNCFAGTRRASVGCADRGDFQRKITRGGDHGIAAAFHATTDRRGVAGTGLLIGGAWRRLSGRGRVCAGASKPQGSPETARGRTPGRRPFIRPAGPSRFHTNNLEGPVGLVYSAAIGVQG